jgi:hypothetical protein
MPKKCVYCGKENVSFTKEHIYPKCLYEKTPEQNLAYVPHTDRIVETELTIKDVCSNCNNGELSKLDDYFCKLFDIYLKNFVHRNDTVDFEYEFDTLARWLLKVSYNSARATKTNFEYLSRFTGYILHNINRPDGLSLFVQLIIPYKMKKEELEAYPRASELKGGEILPTFTRAGEYELRRGDHKFRPGRAFAVNSYYFYIFIRPEDVSEKLWKKFISNMNSFIPGATQLRSFKQKAILRASNVDSLNANLNLIRRNEKAYKEWKSTRQKSS